MKTVQLFLLLYLCAIILFLAHFLIVGSAVYGDGRYYYSYLPTFFIQHTTNFFTSYQFFHMSGPVTPKGLLGNVYAIGPASFWAIPYLLSYLLFGQGNPYTIFLQVFVGLWNITAVSGGLYILFLSLQTFFTKRIAFLATFATFLTTNLFFYGSLDVINSHSAGFFFSCLLLFLITKEQTVMRIFLAGCVVGSLALMRIQDSIFLLLPILFMFFQEKKEIFFLKSLLTIGGFFLVLLPQFFLWQNMWGNALKSPYLYHNGFTFLQPHFFGVLLNVNNGFLLWTPSVIFGFIGLFFFLKQKKTLGKLFLLIFLLQLYIISSWNIWWEGASYSARMMITTYPFLACGFAAFLEKIERKKQYIFLVGFTILNLCCMFLFLKIT